MYEKIDKIREILIKNNINQREINEALLDIEATIYKLNAKRKKYGIVWEDKGEDIAQLLKNKHCLLEEIKEKQINSNENVNLLIEGDNLYSLNALLHIRKNSVNYMVVDPPYNTGNNDFKYNDRFIDKEDTYRHSTWLSFMNKRLKLARELLTDDGVIFISIDDNEVAQLKLLCDEIFGEENMLLNIIVNRPSEIATSISVMKHEYLLAYAKNSKIFSNRNVENNRYVVSRGTIGNEKQSTPKITFPSGLKCYGIEDGTYLETRKIDNSKENVINHTPIIIENGVLKEDVILQARWRSSNDMRNFFKNNCNPTKAKISGEIVEIYFENDRFIPQIKKATGNKLSSLYLNNKKGSLILKDMGIKFDFPKNVNFIKEILRQINIDKDAVVLDFFAGSGTTGHAVLELNEEDGGNRTFILCTNNENNICEEVTYERLNKAINGYTTPKGEEVAGLGGNLKYYKCYLIDKSENIDINKSLLISNMTEMIKIKTDCYNIVEENKDYVIVGNSNKIVGIIKNDFILEDVVNNLSKTLLNYEHKIKEIYTNIELESIDIYKNIKYHKIPKEFMK